MRRNGLTLVELMVVIAIIGLLITLAIPAVQMMRESARRSACANHLRQIGIALTHHQSSFGVFPVGGVETHFRLPQPRRQIAWNVACLPFLEQQPIFEQFHYQHAYNAAENRHATSHVIPTFVCPSAGRSRHTTGDVNGNGSWDPGDDMGLTDYGGMHGLSKPPYLSFAESAPPWVHIPKHRGGMSYEVALKPEDFKDGLSQTVVVAECVRGNLHQSEWANGQNLFDQVYTNPINRTNNNEIFSRHPSGAFVLFGDAHVRFLAETMGQESLNAMLTRAGSDRSDATE